MPIIAFVHIKKTAGKTVKHILRRELGTAHCDVKRWHKNDRFYDAADLQRLRYIYPRLRSIAGHSIRPYSDLRQAVPDLKYYTFLRDPIGRCISQYQYRVKKGRSEHGTFEEWIRDPANHDMQVKTLAGGPYLDWAEQILEREMAFVGLMERLEESLSLMGPALDLPALDLSPARVNAAENNSIRDRLLADSRSMAHLRQANKLDIELYEHAKNVVYPRQKVRFENVILPAADGYSRVSLGRRRGARYYLNGAYRHLVYKPLVWTYRSLSGE